MLQNSKRILRKSTHWQLILSSRTIVHDYYVKYVTQEQIDPHYLYSNRSSLLHSNLLQRLYLRHGVVVMDLVSDNMKILRYTNITIHGSPTTMKSRRFRSQPLHKSLGNTRRLFCLDWERCFCWLVGCTTVVSSGSPSRSILGRCGWPTRHNFVSPFLDNAIPDRPRNPKRWGAIRLVMKLVKQLVK